MIRKGSSGRLTSRSTTTNKVSMATPAASEPTVSADPQPTASAREKPYTRRNTPPPPRAAPTMSTRERLAGAAARMKAAAPDTASAANARLT